MCSAQPRPPIDTSLPEVVLEETDVVVIGGGFGGLGAALGCAEAGARVVLLERVGYLGGCASSFTRRGVRYDAGATVLAGLGEGQLFRRIVERYELPLALDVVDPALELRWGEAPLRVPGSREGLLQELSCLPGAPVRALSGALGEQGRRADALWAFFDDPSLLPPWRAGVLPRLIARVPSLLPLAPWVGRPLLDWVRWHGLEGFLPFRRLLQSLCQITVQVPLEEAETTFGLAAVDFLFRGVRSIRGGVGTLAEALGQSIASRGGEVRTSCRAKSLRRAPGGWVVETRNGAVFARNVVANLVPRALGALLGERDLEGRLARLSSRVEGGYGAVMSYRQLSGEGLPPQAHHLDLVADPSAPYVDGNHVFCSISEPGPDGIRTLTASTHIRLGRDVASHQSEVERVQANLDATIALRAPEISLATLDAFTASPRTFERFTGRTGGLVGGVPRRAGLSSYQELLVRPLQPGLWLAGDSLLFGQSTIAAFVGGLRTSAALLR